MWLLKKDLETSVVLLSTAGLFKLFRPSSWNWLQLLKYYLSLECGFPYFLTDFPSSGTTSLLLFSHLRYFLRVSDPHVHLCTRPLYLATPQGLQPNRTYWISASFSRILLPSKLKHCLNQLKKLESLESALNITYPSRLFNNYDLQNHLLNTFMAKPVPSISAQIGVSTYCPLWLPCTLRLALSFHLLHSRQMSLQFF